MTFILGAELGVYLRITVRVGGGGESMECMGVRRIFFRGEQNFFENFTTYMGAYL